MKLHMKLGIIFSIILVTFMTIILFYWVSFERSSFYNISRKSMEAVGSQMLKHFDSCVAQMIPNRKG